MVAGAGGLRQPLGWPQPCGWFIHLLEEVLVERCWLCGEGDFTEGDDYPFVNDKRVHWDCLDAMEAAGLLEHYGVEVRFP